jgi:methylase of polypeptide subunit release factors
LSDAPAPDALVALLAALRAEGYAFTTVTPATHERVAARRAEGRTLRDVFGWSLPFAEGAIPQLYVDLLRAAGALRRCGALLKSELRVSSLHGGLFLHSAFPTTGPDAVFFGPDTSRYADLLLGELPGLPPPRRIVDVGAGSGAGGILAAKAVPGAALTLCDINRAALHLAAANAAFAGVEAELVQGSGLDAVSGAVDLVIANPPFLMDADKRAYRDGGDMLGARLSLDWALAAAARLEPGGHMILYTGVAICDGQDGLRAALERNLPRLGCALRYREIDPDIFGEELDRPAYAEVERIAAIGAVIAKAARA